MQNDGNTNGKRKFKWFRVLLVILFFSIIAIYIIFHYQTGFTEDADQLIPKRYVSVFIASVVASAMNITNSTNNTNVQIVYTTAGIPNFGPASVDTSRAQVGSCPSGYAIQNATYNSTDCILMATSSNSSSSGGWINNSTTTQTNLKALINNSASILGNLSQSGDYANLSGLIICQNTSGNATLLTRNWTMAKSYCGLS